MTAKSAIGPKGLMRTTQEILFGIQPRSGKLLHLLGCLSRYTRPNCEQLEICLDIEHLLCRNQAKIENIFARGDRYGS